MFEFELKNFPHVSMLKSSTQEIFDIIGRKLEKQGIMLAENLSLYLEKINQAITEDSKHPQELEKVSLDGEITSETRITLKQKSFPLRELMKNAIKLHESIVYRQI